MTKHMIAAMICSASMAVAGAAVAQQSSSGMTGTTAATPTGATTGAMSDSQDNNDPKGVQANKCKGVKANDPASCTSSN